MVDIVRKLAAVGADKYIHLVACQTIAWTVCKVFSHIFPWWVAMPAGFVAAMAVGVAKELLDDREDGNRFDPQDIKADSVGAFMGAVMGI